MTNYTLVQHSAFVGKRDPTFEHAVEMTSFAGGALAARILKAGGKVYADYGVARDAEMAANYPPGVTGLIPRAVGTFSRRILVDGSPVYLPEVKAK